jgi:hypothetical protein
MQVKVISNLVNEFLKNQSLGTEVRGEYFCYNICSIYNILFLNVGGFAFHVMASVVSKTSLVSQPTVL